MSEATMRNSWTRLTFGEMAEHVAERVDPTPADGELYVGLEHLDFRSLVVRRWGADVALIGTKLRMRKGDILFARRNAYLRRVALAPHDGLFSAHGMVLRARTHVVSPEFLPYFMQSDLFMERAKEISVGSLSPTINWLTLAKEEFPVPPLDEQRRIAELLGAAAEVAEALRYQLEAAVIVLKAQIAAFDRNTVVSSARSLNAVVERIEAGRSPSGLGRPADRHEHGVLKVSAVADWSFVERENKMVPPDEFDARFEVRAGDLLVTRANADPDSVGRTCLVEYCRPGLMLSDKTWRLVLKPKCGLDPVGVLAWTKSPTFRKHVRNQLGGTEAKNISKVAFLSAPLPSVSVREFNEFGDNVRSLRSARLSIERRLAACASLGRTLAARALSNDLH
jgi:type I restriction enzyme S subunit